MRIIGVIPSRMASTRFPGKPLALIHGEPMIAHCARRSAGCRTLDALYIATCDDEIRSAAESIGVPAVMTADTHERCTDRVAEAVLKIEDESGERADIVVMIQGDEPMIRPEMIDEALAPMLADGSINLVNLMAPIESDEEHRDPNEVKVVVDSDNFALYFSREPIPTPRRGDVAGARWKQVCVIPFRRDFLFEYSRTPPTPLEKIESVDMLRILETGGRVKMAPTRFRVRSVDTPEDLRAVERMMGNES
ncbi:MAG: 3-deoxy-manno-octulosonate cytidylyltransferase [Phycisphaeraceae bacterium]|nr:MAG: 3-deoxy-manno-octulosonate cytidylyltransferase [Phycisphaeraceae bacterium]